MRNLTLALVTLFALVGVLQTLRAEASPFVRVEQDALSAPALLEDDAGISAQKKDEKKKKKKQDDKDEEDEEDYRSYGGGIGALQVVDPDAV